MLPLLIAALQAATPVVQDTTRPAAPAPVARLRLPLDSIAPRRAPGYATPALAALVARASDRNRRVPPALLGYQARVESEISLVLKRAEGQEVTAAVEQTSNAVRWRRDGTYEQRVVGYRATQVGFAPSIVGSAESAWTVPTLYGNRLLLLFGADSTRRTRRDSLRLRRARGDSARAARNRVYLAEHPLSEERDRFYTFAGGDTVARVVVQGRVLDIVRVRVEPRGGYARRTVVFRGEMDLDARRHHLVRLRGHFDEMGPALPSRRARLASRAFDAVAYVELVNQEVNGAWWLPVYQRIEPQVAVPAIGDGRSALRIVSRWRDMAVDAPGAEAYLAALARGDTVSVPDPALARDTSAAGRADTMVARAHRLTFAPRDSVDRYAAWSEELGAASGAVRADDFDDVAPDRWRATGAPLFRWRVTRPSDLAHFNRVEGLYTGYGFEWKLRDLAPGTSVRGNAGWAWQEARARGRLQVERTHARTVAGVRGGRWVDLTNDFRAALDSGNTLGALLGVDAYDYVDRTGAAAYVTRRVSAEGARPLVARLEAGYFRDDGMRRVVTRGLTAPADTGFRENRGVDAGRYARVVAQLELDPDMAAQSVRPGVGALLHAEVAAGELDWVRLEGRVLARRSRASRAGTSTLQLRGDAGAVLGDRPPPQQLFELGGTGPALSGYEYKAFAGDRAALGRVLAMHVFPIWRRPIRLTRGFALPGLAPGVSVGWQSGWASTGDRAGAAASLVRLTPGALLSRPTDGVRSSIDLRLRFFGGNGSVGVARPVESGGKWRVVAGLVQEI